MALLFACSKGEQASPTTPPPKAAPTVPIAEKNPDPEIDTTTPDRALKSYWAVGDWIRAKQLEKYDAATKAAERKLIERVTAGMVQKNRMDRDRPFQLFDRQIDEVKVETDSRAVAIVTIRNVTPIPSGPVDQDARTLGIRVSGERYKYVLEKTPSGWGVAELAEWDSYGRQWRKTYDSYAKGPMLPHMTYEGR